jgi:predicted nucleic acid-binding protein
MLVVDSSAFARRSAPSIRAAWAEAFRSGRLLVCPPVELELLYSARNGADMERIAAGLTGLRRLPLTDSAARAATAAMVELARRGPPGWHRVRPIDCLVAACAQEAGGGVLHYDHHYDRLAEVMDFESRWILPAGSVD